MYRQSAPAYPDPRHHSQAHYRELQRKYIVRLVLTYLAPLIILIIYFTLQYRHLMIQSRLAHLRAVAENQANTLDLFMRERLVNISNLINAPDLQLPASTSFTSGLLETLQKNSETFVDVGFFDSRGIQTAYAGPYPQLESQDYSGEGWFQRLRDEPDHSIITDIYLGFRQKLHFTLAVSREIGGDYVVLRATLDPEKIYQYISSLEGASEVFTSIVNPSGYYQIVTSHLGTALEQSSIIPPKDPRLDARQLSIDRSPVYFAYSWLRSCEWALIVQWAGGTEEGFLIGTPMNLMAFSAAVVLLIFSIIVIRAKKIVRDIKQHDEDRAQLSDNLLHASKLAAVGELASGIAHEINNPLAVINEEVGLIRDSLDPALDLDSRPDDLLVSLENIQESVYRCRDITRKLLAFVRKSEMNLQLHDMHDVIDEVVRGFYEKELALSNIQIDRQYDAGRAKVLVDRNQIQQVFLNLINNAIDAIDGAGKIVISTSAESNWLKLSVSDTGKGMTQDQLDRIFLPFYTTKDVGKGTGLGLSISYGIVKSSGGEISVTSTLGEGSTFLIQLPLAESSTPDSEGTRSQTSVST